MPQVKIRIEKGQEQAGVGNASATRVSEENSMMKSASMSLFAHQMIGEAKQIANYAVSNVGNFTGDYILQDRINTTMEMLGDAMTLGTAFVSGGPLGVAIAATGIGLKKTLQAVSTFRNDTLAQRNIDLMIARSGNSTKNGSRGTEN